MARFELQLPDEILRDIQTIEKGSDRIFGEMTEAGAQVAYNLIRSGMPKGIASSEMARCLKITRTYRTPSDDGINTKVGFYGYFTNEKGQRVPAPLVANIFEYGRSGKPFQKHPFIRRAFKSKAIEQAMMDAQKRASGGILDE